ncbi:GAF domain-containing sensor histidine kinase [Neobacillus jeddahensis]|uniref:GAF domain-containing sensor histidine kinase n=1 Tax=Neobacillus jeddahensis TaxID=1461580 RepID=UPI0005912934|nr:ATP-binding protein [Neobacillus jeddahensis]
MEKHPDSALAVLERISDGVFSVNLEGQLTYINQSARTIMKMAETDLIGQPLHHHLAGGIVHTITNKITQSLTQQTDLQFQLEHHSAQWLDWHVYAGPDGVTVIVKDITSRKLVEQTIHDQHQKLELLHEASNHLMKQTQPKELLDALFHELAQYLDLDVYFNYMYDRDSEKIRLMNYCGIPADVAEEIEWLEFGEAACGCVARDRERVVVENIDSSDDERVELVKGFGVRAYACHPLLSYGKLIGTLSFGSRKRARFTEAELELIETICERVAITLDRTSLISELTIKKEEAEKANHAKSEFLSMMSHELRTPLHSIIGFAQILEDNQRDPLTSGQQDKVAKLLKAGRHLLSLINNILDIAKLNHEKTIAMLEPIQMGTLVSETIKMVRPLASSKQIHLYWSDEWDSSWTVWADATKVTQVLLNLLGNAIKYTEPYGEISVTCQLLDDQIKICVCDNGIGIAAEEQANIFTPFYRIFNREMNIDGAGMGLTIVKSLVDEMNGTVGVDSIPGEGSHFWFTLPLKKV